MPHAQRRPLGAWLPLLGAAVMAGAVAAPATGRAADPVAVEGDACYRYGGTETPREARDTALTLARQRAVESYATAVESETLVENFKTDRQLTRSIAAGTLRGVEVLDVQEDGRRVCAEIRGRLDPAEVEAAIEDARERAAERERRAAQRSTEDSRSQTAARTNGADGEALPGDERCSAYLPTQVRMTGAVKDGETRSQARARLTQRMMLEAVRQRRGALVRGSRKMLTASKNGRTKERFLARYRSQARGLVRYDVVESEVRQAGAGRELAMTIDARICVPREPLKRTVAVAETRSTDGRPVAELRDVLKQAFSQSPDFVVAAGDASMADVTVRARINHVGVLDRNVSAENLPDSMGELAGTYHRIATNLSGDATFTAMGRTVSRRVDTQDLVPARNDAQLAAESFVKEQMGELADQLRRGAERAVAARSGSDGATDGETADAAEGDGSGSGLDH